MELLTEELLSRPPAARALTLSARAALAVGRHTVAAESARRARRLKGSEAGGLALAEGEARLRLGQPGMALEVARRVLARRPAPDLAARLHLLWAEALGQLGRLIEAERLAGRAAALAREALTLARLEEVRGWLAWARHEPGLAQQRLHEATRGYAACRHAPGVLQALERQSLVLRHAGATRAALDLVERRLELAATTTRLDAVARAHHDRAALLADLGRLAEARTELSRAHDLLSSLQHPQATTLVGATTCRVALLTGDLPEARLRLAGLSQIPQPEPRLAAETALLQSDVLLTEGRADEAELSASAAVGLFRACRDERGTARARLRRASSLLALGRAREALLEARRAARAARPSPPIQALAELNVGRALLRLGRPGADQVFRRASALCPEREALCLSAAIGRLLCAAAPDVPELTRLMAALERTGDRRLLGACREELRRRGLATSTPLDPAGGAVVSAREEVAPLMAAVETLAAEGEWGVRVGRALAAALAGVRSWRAAWIGAGRWLWTPAGPAPTVLPADDCLGTVDLVPAAGSARATPLAGSGSWRMVAPCAEGCLVVDLEAEGLEAAALVAALARLLPAPPSPPLDTPPSAIPGLIGECAALRSLRALLERVAPTRVPVHVFGETGTGKELVARALHERSRRAARHFVVFNAASLSDELCESELFGHVKGAFTGAVTDRRGLVEEADGGTLFVDEVADLSPKAQAKLLRFCETGEFRRVGETQVRRADVRLVSAANLRLDDLVAAGRFREDLVQRLRVLLIQLPPLRERPEDLPALARHFVRLAAAREGRAAPELTRPALERLAAWTWPGNVRELAGELACAVALCDGPRLEARHLSERLRGAGPPARAGLREARARWERDFLADSLRRHGGRRAATAQALGISRQALLEKLRALGL